VEVENVASSVEAELHRAGNPERAGQERRYLKSELQHFGASVPAIRNVADHPALRREDPLCLAEAFWARPAHECRIGRG
jgi:hypothetical protein